MEKVVYFVPESSEKETKHTKSTERRKPERTGEEARQFYENLIAESINSNETRQTYKVPNFTCNVAGENHTTEGKISQSSGLLFSESDFLKAAQNGDIRVVKKCIKSGIEINCVDSYGWTALMCASHSGNEQVVSYLLKKGINRHILDRQRRDAVCIARKAGHTNLADFIYTFDGSRVKCGRQDKQQTETVEYFCDVCKKNVSQAEGENHETSTVHLFNRKLKPKPDSFLIPPGNRGYQLMLKSGWDGEKGLGSRGQGQRYPVKTVLKRDRQCLGGEMEKATRKQAKVTHFGPFDQNAIEKQRERKPKMSTLSKRDKRKQEKKSQVWERNLREEMNNLF